MPRSATLEIHVMNVGQGDSVLVINRALDKVKAAITKAKGASSVPADPIDYVPYALKNKVPLVGTVVKALLIDGGDDEYGGDVLNYLTDQGVLDGKTIFRPDLSLVVSHYHDDHMAGLRSVFKERIEPKKKGDKVKLVDRLRPGTVYQAMTDKKSDPTSQAGTAMSAPVSVTIPALYTCLCLGTPPGTYCGNAAIGDNFDGVALNVTQDQRDASYSPLRTAATAPGRTGWVAVPPGSGGEIAVLAQLTAKLTAKGILSATDASGTFMNSQPFQVRDLGAGGPFTCLCLGVAPGQGCGNDGVGDNYGGVFVNVTQAALDGEFHPARTPSRTGWVSVGNAPYIPLEVLLQIVAALSRAGTLTGEEPFDVFNHSMSVSITIAGDGPQTCVALGAPIGSGTTTKGGHFGDVVVGVASADLDSYQPGQGSGWATITHQPYSLFSAILKLVTLLAGKNILTGTQPYDVFNNATAWRVIGG